MTNKKTSETILKLSGKWLFYKKTMKIKTKSEWNVINIFA